MKIEINYNNSTSALNMVLQPKRGKDLTRQELMEVVGKCIPIKSQIPAIIAEMVKDHTLIKKPINGKQTLYTLKESPIYVGQVQNWVENVRHRSTAQKYSSKVITKDSVVKYLKDLSTKEFTDLLKPVCDDKLCKLYAPAGYNEEAISKLPKEILSKIVKMKEV